MTQRIGSFTVTVQKAHLEWGVHRYTNSRGVVYGEGYILIPASCARKYNLLNLNGTNGEDIFGDNIFYCHSADGTFSGMLRSQGCHEAGDKYAKQFAGDKNLKAVGDWYYSQGVQIGDRVKVTWVSDTEVCIEVL